MKNFILSLGMFFVVLSLSAQNEVGVYYFPQFTSVNNIENSVKAQDKETDDLYTTTPTFSSGFGFNYIHFFNDKYDFRNMLHKIGIRTDLMYSAHNQKWKSEWKPLPEYDTWTHEGKKRLDYLKLAVNLEYFHPFDRHMSYIFYGGPQISYLIKSDGGIVTWKDRTDKGYLFYDLPPASNAYYKKFTLDFVIGGGIDYELTRFINFSTSLRLDYSLTTMDNPDAIDNDYPQFNYSGGRRGSRNMSVAWLLGLEYTLHTPEHSKTRY